MNVLEEFWRQHLPVLPVLLPMGTALLLLALGDGHAAPGRQRGSIGRNRFIALASTTLGLLLAIGVMLAARDGTLHVYRLGEWPAPFGIVLLVDRLAAMMLLLTSMVALPALLHARTNWDRRGRHFHALFQFQLMGLNGAFVTGDLFNLFVFFEVLLIASYTLLIHGQGAERFRRGVQYVVLNLSASALFLIALGLLYASTGTLNMAHAAIRIAEIPADSAALARASGLLLLVVFGLKAALLPIHAWLPATYAAASAPVAALFAIMTKVGVYSIIRVHSVIFGPGEGEAAAIAMPYLLPLALATSVAGVLGALAAPSLTRMAASLTVASVGTILIGVGAFTPEALSAALYYTLHSTLIAAVLFLLAEQIAKDRGEAGDRLQPAPVARSPVILGLMMLLTAAWAAGLPPFPGFIGKLMILSGTSEHAARPWIWIVVLGTGFITMLGLARAGVVLFWQVGGTEAQSTGGSGSSRPPHCEPIARNLSAPGLLWIFGLAIVVFASPVRHYVDQASRQIVDRNNYADAVLGRADRSDLLRPYDGMKPADGAEGQPKGGKN
jgi:multicomponent K+:H+ antiporter subunit D